MTVSHRRFLFITSIIYQTIRHIPIKEITIPKAYRFESCSLYSTAPVKIRHSVINAFVTIKEIFIVHPALYM